MAGASGAIRIAWFDAPFLLPDPVLPNRQGPATVASTGPAAAARTVGGELHQVAATLARGRAPPARMPAPTRRLTAVCSRSGIGPGMRRVSPAGKGGRLSQFRLENQRVLYEYGMPLLPAWVP